ALRLRLRRGVRPGVPHDARHRTGRGPAYRRGARLPAPAGLPSHRRREQQHALPRSGPARLHRRRSQGPGTPGAFGTEPGDHRLRPRHRPAPVGASGEAVRPGPAGIVAVCDDLDPSRAEGTALDYYHGVVRSAEAPEGTTALPVPAGPWAVFTTSGPAPEAIQELWRDVYTQWFPSNPYRTRPGPEILRTRLSADGTEAEAELWLPVERE